MATQPQMTAGGPRQLLLVAALVAVLLLIVGLLVVRPMLGGTDTGQTAPPAVTTVAAPTTTTPQLINPSTSLTPSGGAVASGKDPFRPLVSTGTASAATESGVTATGEAGSVTSSTLAATGSTVGRRRGRDGQHPAWRPQCRAQVALVSISGGTAKVTVDGTAYPFSEGETFATRLPGHRHQLRVRQLRSGTTSFTLCEGEAVLSRAGSDDWSSHGDRSDGGSPGPTTDRTGTRRRAAGLR